MRVRRIGQIRVSGVLAAAAVLVLAILCLWVFGRDGEGPSIDSAETADIPPATLESMQIQPERWEIPMAPVREADTLLANTDLTPQEVIDNPDCGMRMGSGAAANLAVVLVPSSAGARFSVLDKNGAVYSGSLPFLPNHYKIGQRDDGSVVAGFGDLRLNQKGNRGDETAEPVRVYVDGRLEYENNKLWWFGVASDGSSFAAIEPLGSKTSRLIIRNLDEGTITNYYLDKVYGSAGSELSHGVSYTPNGGEVHLRPSNHGDSLGMGVHYFYPTGSGGMARRIRVEQGSWDDIAYIVSSEVGYRIVNLHGGGKIPDYEITKQQFDWATGSIAGVWSRRVQAKIYPGAVRVFGDDEWLMLETSPLGLPGDWDKRAFGMYVLDPRTGETVFHFPTADKAEQFRRLASVMSPEATRATVGQFASASIADGKLLIRRTFSSDASGVYDVFSMDKISVDAQPDFRVTVNTAVDNRCASRSFPRRLQATNGILAYGDYGTREEY